MVVVAVVVVVVVVVICLAVNDMGAEGATAIATAVSGLPMLREWNISSTCVTGAWTPIVDTQRGPAAIFFCGIVVRSEQHLRLGCGCGCGSSGTLSGSGGTGRER